MADRLRDLPNIGPKLELQLQMVGISSVKDFLELGACEAWLRIKQKDPSACLLRLRSLEAACEGIPVNNLSEAKKEELKRFYHEHK